MPAQASSLSRCSQNCSCWAELNPSGSHKFLHGLKSWLGIYSDTSNALLMASGSCLCFLAVPLALLVSLDFPGLSCVCGDVLILPQACLGSLLFLFLIFFKASGCPHPVTTVDTDICDFSIQRNCWAREWFEDPVITQQYSVCCWAGILWYGPGHTRDLASRRARQTPFSF